MAAWVRDGCRCDRGDGGSPRRFSAKLCRWAWPWLFIRWTLEEECDRDGCVGGEMLISLPESTAEDALAAGSISTNCLGLLDDNSVARRVGREAGCAAH